MGIGKKIKRRISPTAIILQDQQEKVLLAQAQGFHNVIYTEYGNVYCWGDNSKGQLGTGDFISKDFPTQITQNFEFKFKQTIVQVSLGMHHSAVLLNDGTAFTWGSNEFS